MERIKLATPRAKLVLPASTPRARLLTHAAPAIITRSVEFMPSGSTLLDKVLGGGWAIGRVANLVGDKASGKTLLAIELCAIFAKTFGVEDARYAEVEAAFDHAYAESIGMPQGMKFAENIATVEDWHDDLVQFLETRRGSSPCLYVVDSLDALSDEAEMKRDIDKGSYGANKPKKISELFRKHIGLIESRNCILLIISQIRDKLNVTFGETKTRSGGRALDFYASQVVWLVEVGKLKRQAFGIERVIGAKVQVRNKKNKVGMAFREAEMLVIYQYGVDDEVSMLNWLKANKALDLLHCGYGEEKLRKEIARARESGERDILEDLAGDLRQAVNTHWDRIETILAPPMRKYD